MRLPEILQIGPVVPAKPLRFPPPCDICGAVETRVEGTNAYQITHDYAAHGLVSRSEQRREA